MLTCKSALGNSNNLVKTNLNDIDNAILSFKNFISMFESSNDNDKKKILESDQYKKDIELLLKYQSNNQNSDSIPTVSNTNITDNSISNNTSNSNNNTSNNNQIINNNNCNNTNCNNNITINNNISVIYPFGYENIYFLSDYEMLDILTSKNCIIDAMNKIYSNVENKNFMKRNMKIDNMTVIDSTLDVQVLNDDVFKRKIIKNTFEALKRMFYHCKDKLQIEHQIMLWQNLRILDESINENMLMRKEKNMSVDIRIIMDTITNMIAADNERPGSKEKFAIVKTNINNEEYKRLFNEKLNLIVSKIKAFTIDYEKRSLDLDIIKTKIWKRDIDNDPLLSLENPCNNILRYNVEDTKRYVFFRDMEILENEYLDNDNNNTTGNIDSLCEIREKVADKELEKYNEKFDLKITEIKTLERKIKNEPKYKARDKMHITRKSILKNQTPAITS